ncbi:HisA/HisF-related TIM barrel protein [Streptomyces noursei]|uniref:HisA/HisF-related TIM barrel protein n=1 Tax=Streptomyces noursei TaxID=1971 RepID=UPI003813B6EE
MPRVSRGTVSAQEAGARARFEVFPSVHVAGGQVVHLVGDGQVPELDRSDPIEAALAFQEQGATWLHLVMTDEEGAGSGLRQARDIIEAVSIDVQLMCRSGVGSRPPGPRDDAVGAVQRCSASATPALHQR